jgi:hypothetical protein
LSSLFAQEEGAAVKNLFNVGVLLVVGLFALGVYWYLNPQRVPAFLRGTLPEVKLRGPTVGYP